MKLTLQHFSFKAMGSFCEIQLFDESRVHAKNVVNQLSDEVARLEKNTHAFEKIVF
tara:strand:+ start:1131 stop:1298 length:168 start_codon:yes stop_codon:yes gene_type:complete